MDDVDPPRFSLALLALLAVTALGGGTAWADTPSNCSDSNGLVTCTLETSNDTTSVDVASLVSDLSSDGVTSGTPIWAQAWGGDGGQGAGYNVNAGGGTGGYAQTVFTLSQLESSYGTSTLYYYAGGEGDSHGSSTDDTEGGDGGAASVLATANLASTTPTIDVDKPTAGNVLLVAGGAGGGAGENVNVNSVGETGGSGGNAVATTSASVTDDGSQGTEKNGDTSDHSGTGGSCPGGGEKGSANGGSGADGGSGVGGTGGGGGKQSSGYFGAVGWVNSSSNELSNAGGGGHGAAGTYDFPNGYAGAGGGGGGGYGGGGGGGSAYGASDPGAGGGGCSFAAEALESDLLAPTGPQANPNGGTGGLQLVFDTVNSTATFEVPAPASPGDSGTIKASYKVATSSGTKTFYASSGTLSGVWDGSTDTLTNASGDIYFENSSGSALDQVATIDEGATLEPVTNGNACSSGEDEYQLDGDLQIINVPYFSKVTATADLVGCGSITGTMSFSGSLTDISPSDIDSATVSDLELEMEPASVAEASSVQSLDPPYARVGCLDQGCKIVVKGGARISRAQRGHKPARVWHRRLAKKVVHVHRGKTRRLRIDFRRQRLVFRNLERHLFRGARARMNVRVRFVGARGAVGHRSLRIKLKR